MGTDLTSLSDVQMVRRCAKLCDMSTTTRTVAANTRAEIARVGSGVQSLAEKIGLNRVTLGRRLSGQLPFTIDEIVAIARALDVPLETLLAGAASEASA